MIESFFSHAIVVIGVIAIFWIIGTFNRRQSAYLRAKRDRRIGPGVLYLILAIALLAIAAGAAYGVYYHYMTFQYSEAWGWFAVSAATFLLGFWSLTSLFPGNHVLWSESGLSGPSNYRPWPFGPARATLSFAEISRVGEDWAQSLFVAAPDGRKVLFSYLFPGYIALMEAIEMARPDLFPEDMDEDG